MSRQKLRVDFLHLDLGIGGAEMLVVSAACALKRRGHEVSVYTTHHDPQHCFAATRGDGELASAVKVFGDHLPRQLLGRFTALFASLRMLYLALVRLWLALLWQLGAKGAGVRAPDIVFLDGVSTPIPVLLFLGAPILFYCHYPDKLLVLREPGLKAWLKALYRLPLNVMEEVTTGLADAVAVNSRFTAGVFRESFQLLSTASKIPLLNDFVPAATPKVLYPAIDLSAWPAYRPSEGDPKSRNGFRAFIVSLNRYERKKNIGLAIEMLSLLGEIGNADLEIPLLVVAGGYDPRLDENVEHLEELVRICQRCGLQHLVVDDEDLVVVESETLMASGSSFNTKDIDVVFLRNVSDTLRTKLLANARCTIYTPDKEHFGIVPLESMYVGTPVLAVASGGPLETIIEGRTGFLANPNPQAFAEHLVESGLVHRNTGLRVKRLRGKAAHSHVVDDFGSDVFDEALEHLCCSTVKQRNRFAELEWQMELLCLLMAILSILVALAGTWDALVAKGDDVSQGN